MTEERLCICGHPVYFHKLTADGSYMQCTGAEEECGCHRYHPEGTLAFPPTPFDEE